MSYIIVKSNKVDENRKNTVTDNPLYDNVDDGYTHLQKCELCYRVAILYYVLSIINDF